MRLGRFSPWALALLSGVMIGASFPPWEHRFLAWLPWVSLAPLCWALWMLPRPGVWQQWSRHAFLLGWLTGTVSFLICLFWITTVTWLGWVLLSLVVGLYPALWALFFRTGAAPHGRGRKW